MPWPIARIKLGLSQIYDFDAVTYWLGSLIFTCLCEPIGNPMTTLNPKPIKLCSSKSVVVLVVIYGIMEMGGLHYNIMGCF